MFFTFDGIDGVGKSTQMDRFCTWLSDAGHDVLTCRDPGSTKLGEQLRSIVLSDFETPIARSSEMLLYMAARAQLVEEVIRPALAAGKTIVSDRYLLANVVYQGHAGGLDVDSLWQVGRVATGGLEPTLTFLLDMPVEEAFTRIGDEPDRMESQGDEFRHRLREGFLAEAAKNPEDIALINAQGSIEEVAFQVCFAAERVM